MANLLTIKTAKNIIEAYADREDCADMVANARRILKEASQELRTFTEAKKVVSTLGLQVKGTEFFNMGQKEYDLIVKTTGDKVASDNSYGIAYAVRKYMTAM